RTSSASICPALFLWRTMGFKVADSRGFGVPYCAYGAVAQLGLFLMALPCGLAAGVQEAQPAFEVASVKPFEGQLGRNTSSMRGGPGTNSPERIDYIAVTAKAVLIRAFGLKSFQLAGPSWLDTQRFNIEAKIPAQISSDEFRQMLQNLLAKRLGLIVHHARKEIPGYGLAVAKRGVGLQPSGSGHKTAEAPSPSGDVPSKSGGASRR